MLHSKNRVDARFFDVLKVITVADLDNLPSPDVLADEIIENLQSALDSFNELRVQLGGNEQKKPFVYPAIEPDLGMVAETGAQQ